MDSDSVVVSVGGRQLEVASATVARLVGAVLVVTGVAHLLRPGTLLETGEVAYGRVLDVGFRPREGASARVRLVGAAMVAAGAHLAYHGGLTSENDGK